MVKFACCMLASLHGTLACIGQALPCGATRRRMLLHAGGSLAPLLGGDEAGPAAQMSLVATCLVSDKRPHVRVQPCGTPAHIMGCKAATPSAVLCVRGCL